MSIDVNSTECGVPTGRTPIWNPNDRRGFLIEPTRSGSGGIRTHIDGIGRANEVGKGQIVDGQSAIVRTSNGNDEEKSGIDEALSGNDEEKSGIDEALSGIDEEKSGIDEALSDIDEEKSVIDETLSGIDGASDAIDPAWKAVDDPLVGIVPAGISGIGNLPMRAPHPVVAHRVSP